MEEDLINRDNKVHLPTLVYILGGVFAIGESKLKEDMSKMVATNVSGVMEKEMHSITSETPIAEIANSVIEKGINYFPVINNGKLAGVVTKKDFVRAISQGKI